MDIVVNHGIRAKNERNNRYNEFALPTISIGLNATKSWNALLRGCLFAPFFVSRTNLEATNIYNATQKTSNIN